MLQGAPAIAPRSASRPSNRPPARNSSGGVGPFLLGFLVCAVLAAGAWFYFQGKAPLMTKTRPPRQSSMLQPATPAPPDEAPGMASPVHDAPKPAAIHYLDPPFGSSEDVFEAGAKTYALRCAACHGTPSHDGTLAATTNPPALQLWRRRAGGAGVGDSSLAPGEIYSKTRYGVPHSGMPAYKGQLTDTQIWQVALLLKNAGEPLPDPVRTLLQASAPPSSH